MQTSEDAGTTTQLNQIEFIRHGGTVLAHAGRITSVSYPPMYLGIYSPSPVRLLALLVSIRAFLGDHSTVIL
jgi:hypothetical protein